MTKLDHGWLASVGIVFVVGSAGGYTVGHLQQTDRTAELEQEIVRLEKEFGQKQWAFEFPSDTEASAAIAKSGLFDPNFGMPAPAGGARCHLYRRHHHHKRIICRGDTTRRPIVCKNQQRLGANAVAQSRRLAVKMIMFLTAGLIGALSAMSAKAQDAEWGCQVLLCAASKNPSWHGVPYCVPPMRKLIDAMSKPGFSWPVCHEAKAGKPGRKDYEDCPAGTIVGYSSRGGDNSSRSEPDQCIETVNICRPSGQREGSIRSGGLTIIQKGDGDSCTQQIATPRPRRADPYYFDIPNSEGMKERFWFNLND